MPLINDSYYNVSQIGLFKRNEIEILVKDYWIINNFNHIYGFVGNDNLSIYYQKNEEQQLSSGIIHDFKSAGFGNELNYKKNHFYFGIEYKFIFGKWISKLTLTHNLNNQNIHNFQVSNNLKSNCLTPKFESEYKFSNAHILQFNYEFTNQFPEYNKLANRFNIQSFNTVYKGNESLKNEQFHTSTLIYKKNDIYHSLVMDGMINYTYKVNSIRDAVYIDGTNQKIIPFLNANPEKTIDFKANLTKNISQFVLGLNSNLSTSEYSQFLNTIQNKVKHNSKDFGIILKTNNTKWPLVTIGYTKIFDDFEGASVVKIKSNRYSLDIEYDITKNIVFYADGMYQKNTNAFGSSYNQLTNASIEYKKENNPWTFEVSSRNVLDNGKQSVYSISDYMINEQTTYVLPRVVMLSVSYKL